MTAQALTLSYKPVSPWLEMGAYEFLWTALADKFRGKDALPSDFVISSIAEDCARETTGLLKKAKVEHFGLRLNGTSDYPERLRDARNPVQLLYFQGSWDLEETPSVAVVGTREPTDEGKARAAKLARHLSNREVFPSCAQSTIARFCAIDRLRTVGAYLPFCRWNPTTC